MTWEFSYYQVLMLLNVQYCTCHKYSKGLVANFTIKI